MTFDVNWLAVLVAALVNIAVGFLWYGPLFGKQWLAAFGKRPEELGNPTRAILTSALMALIAALALAMLVVTTQSSGAAGGIALGLLVAVGFVLTTQMISQAYESGPAAVRWIFISYQLVVLALMGLLLALWR